MGLSNKYGPWAVVAGGSCGMGGAFSDRLAKEGFNVVVTARRQEVVDKKCKELEEKYHIQTMGIAVDFEEYDAPDIVIEKTKDLEVGFLVYNVGVAYAAWFHSLNMPRERRRINSNIGSLLALTLHFLPKMAGRNRGGLILLSSNTGLTGHAFHTTYAATKAYIINLAESLWGEYAESHQLDIMAVCPGQTIGQNFTDVPPGTYGFQTGAEVVEEAFQALGKEIVIVTKNEQNAFVAERFHPDERKECILFERKIAEGFIPPE